MTQFFGQFQTVSRRHRRKEFGTLKVCVENVITGGRIIEPYLEFERPPDMWKLGIIRRGSWLSWDAASIDAPVYNVRVLEGEQPDLVKIAGDGWESSHGESVLDVMPFSNAFKLDPSQPEYIEQHESDAIPDGFLKPAKR